VTTTVLVKISQLDMKTLKGEILRKLILLHLCMTGTEREREREIWR
jgi:hypothetical protein